MLEELGLELTEPTLKVLNILEKKPEVSETDIAEKLDIKINTARKLLYRLSELSIAEYTKKRHEEKKWWYVYFWHIDKRKIYQAYLKKKKQQLENKKQLLDAERKYAFICSSCKSKYTYTTGLESDFTCAACDKPLSEIKTSRDIKILENEISVLEGEIVKISDLIEKTPRMDGIPKEEEKAKEAKAVEKPKKAPVKKPVKKKPAAKPKKAPVKKPVKKKPKIAKKPSPKKPKPAEKAPSKKKKKKEEKEEEKKKSLKSALARVLRRRSK